MLGWIFQSYAGLKIAGRNINNLRNADDTTLMAESKEETKKTLEGHLDGREVKPVNKKGNQP